MSDEISRLCNVGIKLGGTSYGALPTSYSRGLLVKSFDANPGSEVAPVPEVRGKLATMRVTIPPVSYAPKLNFALDVGDPLSAGIGDFLASVYGKETGTKDGSNYKHKFQLKNTGQPPWLNIWSDKDAVPKQVVGFRVGSLKMVIDAKQGLIPVDVTGMAKDESNLASQSLAFSDEALLTPHMATILKLGGASVETFESIELTLIREQEGLNFVGSSRTIGDAVSGKSFAFEIVLNGLNFADETERAKFKAVGTSSFELKLIDPAGNYLHCVAPQINYKSFEGPGINDADLLRLSIAAFVTGDEANHYIELQNLYTRTYDTDTLIS